MKSRARCQEEGEATELKLGGVGEIDETAGKREGKSLKLEGKEVGDKERVRQDCMKKPPPLLVSFPNWNVVAKRHEISGNCLA